MSDNSLMQEMIDSSEEIEAIFHEYILTKDNNSESYLFCFFEGNDDYKYYCPRIKLFSTNEIITYECGGKDNVLTLYGMIKENTMSNEANDVLFFIDKDFDNDENIFEDIYVTPCYSIENFYITNTAFSEFLKGELKISRNSPKREDKQDYEKAITFFSIEKGKFINETLLLNVWYSLQKSKSKKIIQGSKPDLTKIKNIKNIEFPITLDSLKELTQNYADINNAEITNETVRLLRNPEYSFRGKYFEEFLYKILTIIITDSNKPKMLFSKRRRVNINVGKDNLISLLSQYADVPLCLKAYLINKIKDNNNERRLASS